MCERVVEKPCQMTIVDYVYDVGQWSSPPAPYSLDFLTSCFVRGSFKKHWPVERAAQELFVCMCVCMFVHVYCPVERINDVTDPCSTIGPVDVSWQIEKNGSVHCPALWLHYTVIDHSGHHPGLRYTTNCTYLFIAADNGELTLKEYDPLMAWCSKEVTQLLLLPRSGKYLVLSRSDAQEDFLK